MDYIVSTLSNLIHQTAFFNLTWGNYLMILAGCLSCGSCCRCCLGSSLGCCRCCNGCSCRCALFYYYIIYVSIYGNCIILHYLFPPVIDSFTELCSLPFAGTSDTSYYKSICGCSTFACCNRCRNNGNQLQII